jgi:hypothetical protein
MEPIPDTIPPRVQLNSPDNNSIIKPGRELGFSIYDGNLNYVVYTIDGGPEEIFLYPYKIYTDNWSDGTHEVLIKANDTDNNTAIRTYHFIVDSIAPSILLNHPENNSIITGGVFINFSIIDTNQIQASYTINNDTSNQFDTPYNISTTGWLDDDYTILIDAIDETGNINSSWFFFTIDTIPPMISSVNVTNITNNSATITWISNEPSDLRVNWSLNPDLSFNYTIFNLTLTTFHYVTLTDLEPDQTYYFEVTSVDFIGNSATDSNSSMYYRFTTIPFDIQKPIISNVAVIPSTQEVNGYVYISSMIYDNNEVYGAWVKITDPLGFIIDNISMEFDSSSGKYYFNSTYSEPGNYYFTIWTNDSSNNSASMSGIFEIIEIDTIPPNIVNVQAMPSPAELGRELNISATISDNVEIDGVWLQIFGPDGTEQENFTLFKFGHASYWCKKVYPDLGIHTYKIWAKDTNENWRVIEGAFVIQDTTSPQIDAGSNHIVSQGGIVTFDGSSSSDNDVIENYTWSFNYDGETISLYGINPSFKFGVIGNYTITLTVDDPSGNLASTSIWINVFGVDKDGDGLTDHDEENIYETNPNVPDTDGDGVNDGDEIDRGTNPLVPDKIKGPKKSFLEESWWIFLVLAIIIIILILFLLTRRKEGEIAKEEDLAEDPGKEIVEEPKETEDTGSKDNNEP